ncbi:hypothetical protein AN639_05625 [Candidatus Epulonipiscium fishelsonii]|uniref:Uncharacterized protein n=1 Tax=Candidatus Epulonipiscium fishelsonii TaxID=77094 RepID=A0ACC8X9A1_9FIRM|nr:hypothetical protein AN396_10660 [Epulopiscium sp. SCG-B11WGA-EpuloA1]ONI39928.1 hypothetical protein AN639_05625 [Epulopiscium sp. SCG-B05WGA-EpuloA1]
MKISLCLITKNEEHNIAKCINSVKNIVDEIVVVDTGSTDKTVEIAKQHGANIYYFEWVNDFSKARNYAKSKVTGDWIIFLDADEYLEEGKQSVLLNYIKQVDQMGYETIVIFRINYDPKKSGFDKGGQELRIFKNKPYLLYKRPIHETLVNINKELDAIVLPSEEIKLYHTGYSEEELTKKDTLNRNINILLEAIKNDPTDQLSLIYLGREYCVKEDYKNSFYYLNLVQNLNDENISRMIKEYYSYFLHSATKLDTSVKEIFSIYENAIKYEPNLPDVHYSIAMYCIDKKAYQEAIIYLEATLNSLIHFPRDQKCRISVASVPFLYLNLAESYFNQNLFDKTISTFTEMLTFNKWYKAGLIKFLEIMSSNAPEDVAEFLKEFYNFNNQKEIEFITSCAKEANFIDLITML